MIFHPQHVLTSTYLELHAFIYANLRGISASHVITIICDGISLCRVNGGRGISTNSLIISAVLLTRDV